MGDYTKSLNNRVLTRGPKEGHCAICSFYGVLTKDHVPPQGCGNIEDVELYKVFVEEGDDKEIANYSQGGLHFKTICGNCNSNLLGTEYDPALIHFCRGLTERIKIVLEGNVAIPRYVSIEIQPQRVARAIVGHLIATKSHLPIGAHPDHVNVRAELVDYFLRPDSQFPKNVELFYWLYPYQTVRVLTGASKLWIGKSDGITGDIIKFFPLGFWLVYNRSSSISVPHAKFSELQTMGLDESRKVQIDLSTALPESYPESPGKNGMLMLNSESAFFAKAKRKRFSNQ